MLVSLGLLAVGAHTPTEEPPTPREEDAPTVRVPETSEKPTPAPQKTYPVLKVIDGDTVVIKKDGENTTLRLIGMDAPETTTLRKGVVECFGAEATRRAQELLDGASVSLETDASQGTYDKYERTLVYIFLPDGRNFAEVMIVEGYAHEYTYNLPYTYQRAFKAAQTQAQQSKVGLWNPRACTQTTKAQVPAAVVATSGNYECSKNTYNCSSFKAQSEAQSAFDSCGGSENDIHKLDSDGDGRVCEGLP